MKDETKPNEENRVWSEPELEAQIVAWVAGEAAELSPAELEGIVAARPELANFKRRIELVRDLLAGAAQPETEPLRLSADRRGKLMKALGADAAVPSSREPVTVLPSKTPWWRIRDARFYLVAGGMAAGLVGLIMSVTIPAFQKVRPAPESADRAEAQMRVRELAARDVQEGVLMQRIEIPVSMLDRGGVAMAPPPVTTDEATSLSRVNVDAREGARFRGFGGAQAPSAPAPTLLGAAPARGSASQTVTFDPDAPKPDAIVKLDAFVVSEARDAGYAAASSIAGARTQPAPSFGDSLRQSQQAQFGPAVPAEPNTGLGIAGQSASVTATFGQDQRAQVSVGGLVGEKKEGSVLAAGSITLSTVTTGGALALSPVALSELELSALPKDKAASDDRPLARISQSVPIDALRAEIAAKNEAISTFSLHVSDVSFRLAHAALLRGEMPEPARIRPEEFYNAFNYGDPLPTMDDKVACRLEQAAHPFLQARNLLRIAIKVPATGRTATQALRLTVLLDTSGSMEREDRAASVRAAFKQLIALLGPNDRITLIGFARQPRLLAEAVAGDQAGALLDIVARTPADGGTNMEEALKLASDLARRHRLAGAQNRIIMLTDGAANLGNANPDQLAKAIDALRGQGIAFDACGVGLDGLDDAVLEALTRRGDGRYYVLNSPEAADAGFARQIAGALRPAAENVKLQVRFNPARVGHYRLIGFDQHRLRTEDFRNDKVDAAELAAEEAAVALYQIEALPQGAGDVGEVFVRFRDAATGQMVERSWTITHEAAVPAFDRATPSIQLAGVAAMMAERLRLGAAAQEIKLRDLAAVVQRVRGHYSNEPRVQELIAMYNQARRLGVE